MWLDLLIYVVVPLNQFINEKLLQVEPKYSLLVIQLPYKRDCSRIVQNLLINFRWVSKQIMDWCYFKCMSLYVGWPEYLGVFGVMAPVGLLFGSYLTTHFAFDLDWIMAIAIGMFLHISTTIIFESSEGHKINFMKLLAIVVGFGLGVVLS